MGQSRVCLVFAVLAAFGHIIPPSRIISTSLSHGAGVEFLLHKPRMTSINEPRHSTYDRITSSKLYHAYTEACRWEQELNFVATEPIKQQSVNLMYHLGCNQIVILLPLSGSSLGSVPVCLDFSSRDGLPGPKPGGLLRIASNCSSVISACQDQPGIQKEGSDRYHPETRTDSTSNRSGARPHAAMEALKSPGLNPSC